MEQLEQRSTHEIDIESTRPRVFFCIRNEKFRLPFFLDYYRNLGIEQFFAVDNNSTDDTLSYLLEQPDVHVFYTEQSYKESNAGRAWTSYLARTYAMGKWCLTLDVDEFLQYPGIEFMKLHILCSYMERWGYQGMFTIFLDFYSDKPVDDTHYKEGDNVFEVCPFHDSTKSYSTFSSINFPYLQIKGGIRQRRFWDAKDPKSGPSMRKIPLVLWDEKFDYVHSTHSTTQITLADVSGALAHFKFMGHFKEFAKQEVRRNDRVENSKDWKVYADSLDNEKINFFDPALSVRYTDSMGLYKAGFLSCSVKYRDYRNRWNKKERKYESAWKSRGENSRDMIVEGAEAPISYDQMMKIWPGISNLNLNLPYTNIGRRKDDGISFFRLEDRIHQLLRSRQWALTRPIRLLATKLRIADRRSMFDLSEDLDKESLYTIFKYTYDSFWWDLLAPGRIVMRLFYKSKHHLKSLYFRTKLLIKRLYFKSQPPNE